MSQPIDDKDKQGYFSGDSTIHDDSDSRLGLTITPMGAMDDESMITEEYDEESHIQAVLAMSRKSSLGNGPRRSSPGAVSVPGINQQRSTQPDEEALLNSPIVAQLAHDDVDDVAARVAERLERRMTDRLRHEVEAHLSLERSNHDAADQAAVDRHPPHFQNIKIQQAEEAFGDRFLDMDENFKICGIRRTCWGLTLTTIFLLMTGALTGVIFLFTGNDYMGPRTTDSPSEAPTNPPSENGQTLSILERIGPSITFESDEEPYRNFNDPTTPQFMALNWLTKEDAFVQDRQSTLSDIELTERYLLAVFYYATMGANWKDDLNFLQPISICGWNNGINVMNENAVGVYCSGSNVTLVQIGK